MWSRPLAEPSVEQCAVPCRWFDPTISHVHASFDKPRPSSPRADPCSGPGPVSSDGPGADAGRIQRFTFGLPSALPFYFG